ncbi:MAG: hypothetical protein QXX57_04050 [Nitrososphaerota archaeon]
MRIPNMYKSLLHLEANNWREVRIALWVEDGIPYFSYKEHEEPPFIPSGRQPQYDRGEWYCSKCCQTSPNRDKCPNRNRVLRKKPRKKEKQTTYQHMSYIICEGGIWGPHSGFELRRGRSTGGKIDRHNHQQPLPLLCDEDIYHSLRVVYGFRQWRSSMSA